MTGTTRDRVLASWSGTQEQLIRHTSELVQLDTSNPPGSEELVARYLSRELDSLGIRHEILESAPGRANLVARLPGSGAEAPLMLLGHADVVGADPEGWPHPPFSGHVADGLVWGRGTVDMKGHIAAYLVILELLVTHRVRLRRDVLLVVTADEESGSHLGAHWLREHHGALVEAEIAFNEGGGQRFVTPGGPLYTVQVAEKGNARIRLTARGAGGHASVPRPGNAVFALAEALTRLAAFEPESVLGPESVHMVQTLARHHEGQARTDLLQLLAEPTWARAGAVDMDPVLREYLLAGLHNTAVPTMLHASDRTNAVADRASVVLDGRTLPGQDPAAWADRIQAAVGDTAEVELLHGRQAPPPAYDPHVLDVLQQVMAAHEPGAHILPYVNAAATDARALPGVRVHGFFPSRSDADIMRLAHGRGEHARIDDLVFGGSCLLDAVLRLAEGEPG